MDTACDSQMEVHTHNKTISYPVTQLKGFLDIPTQSWYASYSHTGEDLWVHLTRQEDDHFT